MKKKYKALLSIFAICVVTFSLVWFPSQAVAKDVTLNFTTYLPSTYEYFYVSARIADYINKHGKDVGLKCKFYKDVYKIKELLPAIDAGELDMITALDGFFSKDIPVYGVISLPWITDEIPLMMPDQVRLFGRNSPWFKLESRELAKRGLKLIGIMPAIERQFMTTKPIEKLEDWKGKKIRCSGAIELKTLELLGAKGVSMPSSELYGAMQRGMIDGCVGSLGSTFLARHIYEVCPYITRAPGIFQGSWSTVIKLQKWNSLSQDQQELLYKACEIGMLDSTITLMKKSLDEWALFAEKGIKTIMITGKEKERWKKATHPAFDWYLKKMGPLGKESLEALRGK